MKIACHTETRKAHMADCKYAAMIRDEDLAVFDELSEALAEGYLEAGCCLTDKPFRWRVACSFCGAEPSKKTLVVTAGGQGAGICRECAAHLYRMTRERPHDPR